MDRHLFASRGCSIYRGFVGVVSLTRLMMLVLRRVDASKITIEILKSIIPVGWPDKMKYIMGLHLFVSRVLTTWIQFAQLALQTQIIMVLCVSVIRVSSLL